MSCRMAFLHFGGLQDQGLFDASTVESLLKSGMLSVFLDICRSAVPNTFSLKLNLGVRLF